MIVPIPTPWRFAASVQIMNSLSVLFVFRKGLAPNMLGLAQSSEPSTGRAIRVSGALTAIERHDPDPSTAREHGRIGRADNQAVGARESRHE